MVKPKDELLKWAIKNTQMRIKHHEKSGKGGPVMDDKKVLQKQQRIKQLLEEKRGKKI